MIEFSDLRADKMIKKITSLHIEKSYWLCLIMTEKCTNPFGAFISRGGTLIRYII